MEEIWKDIPGYEGYYQASNTGKYKSVDREVKRTDGVVMHIKGKELKLHKGLDDYALMELCRDNRVHPVLAHRVIAQLFLDDFDSNLTVNHKDGNKFNNSVENLEMMTLEENLHHFHTAEVFAETRMRIAENTSKIHKGRKRSQESIDKWKESYAKYIEKNGGTRKGAIIDEELRKKISFSQGKHIKCVEEDLYFTSIKRAADYYNVDISTMTGWVKQGMDRKMGNANQKCYGLHFVYTNDDDMTKYTF